MYLVYLFGGSDSRIPVYGNFSENKESYQMYFLNLMLSTQSSMRANDNSIK